ncbi:MAG TPA: hypothetical protein VMB50_14325 [Myxococcales bacterium]|nr:hypothetical protein [Myxococcales bacterium]
MRISAVFLLSILLGATSARAALCPAPPGTRALATVDSEARVSFLLRALHGNAARLRTWSLVWGTTYAAAAAGQLSVLPFVDDGARFGLTTGAISAVLGSAALFLLPLRLTLADRVADSDLGAPDRCAVLARVEKRFFDAARIDRLSDGWIAQGGNVVVNATLAVVLWLGTGSWTAAAIGLGIGLVVGEANLLTQPHGLVAAEETYLAGALPQDQPQDLPRPAGLSWAW